MAKLLIAEDDADLMEFLRTKLTQAGFAVTTANNGADAVVLAVEGDVDLVLLDMLMPRLDGLQVSRLLRKLRPHLPILALTGYVGQGYMAEAAALGITCLAKPISSETLIRELHEALQNAVKQGA